MIELIGVEELEEQYLKVKVLPVKVQEQIKQTLIVLDESYGDVGKRTFEGGKVVVVEGQEDAEQVNAFYGLTNNEFADEVHTNEGTYLMVLVIFGTENSIMIVGKQEIIQPYL